MDFKQQIEQLLHTFLAQREDLFLVQMKISPANDVTIILDGDNGVSVQDCLDASRSIEFNMDREVQDFSLQVMSSGLSEPLSMLRQYQKNIGRKLTVLNDEDVEIEGELIGVDQDKITLLRKYRKPKEIGKGKMDVEEEVEILFSRIKRALVVIQF